MNSNTASQIIDLLGGTSAVARLLGIKPPSVTGWRDTGTIPEDRLIRLAPRLEEISGGRFTRKSLFPDDWQDIWPELAAKRRKPAAAKA